MYRTIRVVGNLRFLYFLDLQTALYKLMVTDEVNKRQHVLSYESSPVVAIKTLELFAKEGFKFGDWEFEGTN
jgi:hypothetical protein